MNTYQRQLLDTLITELTANASPNLHTAQMLAAELKGAMQAQTELDDIHPITCDCAKCVPLQPTPDADGWVENTGADPNCEFAAVKFVDGSVITKDVAPYPMHKKNFLWSAVTHYKPA